MRANEDLVIVGSGVVLVPYLKEHVERYHAWMQDEFLLEMTASEPLSIEEEYAMQTSWHMDDDKCTFIVISRKEEAMNERHPWGSMVGDVNLFFNNDEDKHEAEVEVMIAEEKARRKGHGLEALMMAYGVTDLGVTSYTVKISLSNEASISMFTKKLHFETVSTSEVFQEVTLGLSVAEGSEARQQLIALAAPRTSFSHPDSDTF